MKHIVLEPACIDYITCYIHSFSISSTKFDLTLIVISVGIDKSAKAIGKASSKRTFIVPTRRIEILTKAMRFMTEPFTLINYPSSIELEELV